MKLAILGLLLSGLFLLSCTGSDNSEDSLTKCLENETDCEAIVFQELRADFDRRSKPDATPAEIRSMQQGNVSLGLDLFHALALKEIDNNIAVSPFSMRMAFGMLQAAARGQAEKEIAEVMGFLKDQERLHNAFNYIDLELFSRNLPESEEFSPVILETANRMFSCLECRVSDTYLETLAVHYGAGVFLADFAREPALQRKKINKWVEQQTHDRIVDLLPDGAIDSSTVWVLINAIYLKAPWSLAFDVNQTRDAAFTLLDGTEVVVPTMNASSMGANYAQGDGYKILDLPLRGERLTATFILPDRNTYTLFESELSQDKLESMLSGLTRKTGDISIPRFQIKTGTYDFNQILKDLGLSILNGGGDFSGFGPRCASGALIQVFQSVFVAVDETGVEAAAATAVVNSRGAFGPEENFNFRADRPFLFLIRDLPTGLVLFAGRVVDPSIK